MNPEQMEFLGRLATWVVPMIGLITLISVIATPTILLMIWHKAGLIHEEMRVRRVIELAREETRTEPTPQPCRPQARAEVKAEEPPAPRPAEPEETGPRFYVLVDQERQGPMPKSRLLAKLERGQITSATPCREETSIEWRTVAELLASPTEAAPEAGGPVPS
jgi:hypothetical protein